MARLSFLDRWLYFLRHAAKLDAEERSRLLVDTEYGEAAEVLNMFSRSPEDRQFYEARMEFLHDADAKLIHAREKGREEGVNAGKVRLLQQLLGDREQPLAELLQLGDGALEVMLATLQQRLRSRNC